jgi:hypothetical protein
MFPPGFAAARHKWHDRQFACPSVYCNSHGTPTLCEYNQRLKDFRPATVLQLPCYQGRVISKRVTQMS